MRNLSQTIYSSDFPEETMPATDFAADVVFAIDNDDNNYEDDYDIK